MSSGVCLHKKEKGEGGGRPRREDLITGVQVGTSEGEVRCRVAGEKGGEDSGGDGDCVEEG